MPASLISPGTLMNSLELQLLSLVQSELGLASDHPIGLDSRLADLGDSLAWVGLLSAVEDAFDLRIDTEQSLSLVTVGDLVRFVGEPTHA